MKMLHLIPVLALAACTMGSVGGPYESSAEAEAELEEQLAGRVAEPPVACVRSRDIRGNTPIDERTILFEGRGDLLYVNRTRSACAGIRPWHAIRLRTIGPYMCTGELIVAFDPTSGIERGGCTLGEFTPFRRAG